MQYRIIPFFINKNRLTTGIKGCILVITVAYIKPSTWRIKIMVNDNKTGSFKSWMKGNFETSELERMLEYGADSGFDGLIYYSETCELYERFKTEIWEMLAEDTESPG